MEQKEIAAYVRMILTEKATDILLRNDPDFYYGWSNDHWLGEKLELKAKEALSSAERRRDRALANIEDLPKLHPEYASGKAVLEAQQAEVDKLRKNLEKLQKQVQAAIERRREFRIQALATKLFMRYFNKARVMPWPLYDPGIPNIIRKYVLAWKGRPLTPTSLVFLWLVVEESNDHGETFQVEGADQEAYLLQNPLALSPLDIDALEVEPTKKAREYLRELQRKEAVPVHENRDSRDNRADNTYDGLPSLPVMWTDDDDPKKCTCGQYRRNRIVHIRSRYYYVEACPNFATTCRFEYLTQGFVTKEELAEHLAVHNELMSA